MLIFHPAAALWDSPSHPLTWLSDGVKKKNKITVRFPLWARQTWNCSKADVRKSPKVRKLREEGLQSLKVPVWSRHVGKSPEITACWGLQMMVAAPESTITLLPCGPEADGWSTVSLSWLSDQKHWFFTRTLERKMAFFTEVTFNGWNKSHWFCEIFDESLISPTSQNKA